MTRTLIVDDEPETRLFFSTLLSEKGHVIQEASSAKMAYEKLKREHFDLVLLDICMPEIDGIQALQEIRCQGYTTPVIVITGYPSIEAAVEAVEVKKLGATDFLKKSFDNQHLLSTIDRVLKKEKVVQYDTLLGKKLVEKLDLQKGKSIASAPPSLPSTDITSLPSTDIIRSKKKRIVYKWITNIAVFLFTLGTLSVGVYLINAHFLQFTGGEALSSFRTKSVQSFITLPIPRVLTQGFLAVPRVGVNAPPAVSAVAGEASGSFTLPFENVSALSWHNGYLWIVDWVTHTVYQSTFRENEIVFVKTFYLPQLSITGFCFVGDYIYTCDASQKLIRKHQIDNLLTVIESYASPGPNPSALSWDGQFLWLADSETARIYKLTLTPTFSTVASYSAASQSPIGIYADDKYFWSADGKTCKIYLHALNEDLKVLKSYTIPEFLEGTNPLSAFTISDQNILIAREGINKIYQLPKSQLKSNQNE